jgi:hypothetical protein
MLILTLVFIHVQSVGEAALFESQVPTIVTLTKGCKSAQVIRDLKDIPAGCGGAVVTSTIAVHTLVRVSKFGLDHHFFLLFDINFKGTC